MISQSTIDEVRRVSDEQAAARSRMTPECTVRKAQLMALFDKSDERGQTLLLAIAAIHATRYPKEQS